MLRDDSDSAEGSGDESSADESLTQLMKQRAMKVPVTHLTRVTTL